MKEWKQRIQSEFFNVYSLRICLVFIILGKIASFYFKNVSFSCERKMKDVMFMKNKEQMVLSDSDMVKLNEELLHI